MFEWPSGLAIMRMVVAAGSSKAAPVESVRPGPDRTYRSGSAPCKILNPHLLGAYVCLILSLMSLRVALYLPAYSQHGHVTELYSVFYEYIFTVRFYPPVGLLK
jgi:hypothetical protein